MRHDLAEAETTAPTDHRAADIRELSESLPDEVGDYGRRTTSPGLSGAKSTAMPRQRLPFN
jgi:hypothetical protein